MQPRDPNEQIFDEAIDDDNPEWTDDDFRNARPASEVSPNLVEAYRQGRVRGPQRTPTKQLITIRLSRDVVAAYKAGGEGWQSRIDEDLRQLVRDRAMAAIEAATTVFLTGDPKYDDENNADMFISGSHISVEPVEPDESKEHKKAG